MSSDAIEMGFLGDVEGLDDWICTEGDCKVGRASVARMMSTWKSFLDANKGVDVEMKLAPMVRGVKDAFDAADKATWYPFAPGCCTVRQVGARADEVTNILLKELGNTTVPGGISPPVGKGALEQLFDTAITLAKWGLIGTGIYLGGKFAYNAYRDSQNQKQAGKLATRTVGGLRRLRGR